MNRFAALFRTLGILLALPAFVAPAALADELLLKSGGRLNGVVVGRTAGTVTLEVSAGRVTLPRSVIASIVDGPSALEVWRERASALAPGNLEGWVALARWADGQGLATQTRESWQHVLSLDPRHPEANAALGRVSVDGVWMSREDAYRARGYVPFEGGWVTPAEREALEQERRADEELRLQRREADLRAREAEARAREAEARARQAEAAGEGSEGGIPLWWGGGGYLPVGYGAGAYGPYGYGYGSARHRHVQGGGHHGSHAAPRPPVVAAPPSTPPSSIGLAQPPHPAPTPHSAASARLAR